MNPGHIRDVEPRVPPPWCSDYHDETPPDPEEDAGTPQGQAQSERHGRGSVADTV